MHLREYRTNSAKILSDLMAKSNNCLDDIINMSLDFKMRKGMYLALPIYYVY